MPRAAPQCPWSEFSASRKQLLKEIHVSSSEVGLKAEICDRAVFAHIRGKGSKRCKVDFRQGAVTGKNHCEDFTPA